jgi:hypothetical protein
MVTFLCSVQCLCGTASYDTPGNPRCKTGNTITQKCCNLKGTSPITWYSQKSSDKCGSSQWPGQCISNNSNGVCEVRRQASQRLHALCGADRFSCSIAKGHNSTHRLPFRYLAPHGDSQGVTSVQGWLMNFLSFLQCQNAADCGKGICQCTKK